MIQGWKNGTRAVHAVDWKQGRSEHKEVLIVPLYAAIHTVRACGLSLLVCYTKKSIHQYQHEGGLIVPVRSGNKLTTSHARTHTHTTDTLHVPVRHLPTYPASLMLFMSIPNAQSEKR